MKKILTLVVLSFTLTMNAFAAQKLDVEVNGLVCDFCAQALEKVFGKKESVKEIDVNLTERYVRITLNEGKEIADEEVKKLIIDAGYDVVKINRVEE